MAAGGAPFSGGGMRAFSSRSGGSARRPPVRLSGTCCRLIEPDQAPARQGWLVVSRHAAARLVQMQHESAHRPARWRPSQQHDQACDEQRVVHHSRPSQNAVRTSTAPGVQLKQKQQQQWCQGHAQRRTTSSATTMLAHETLAAACAGGCNQLQVSAGGSHRHVHAASCKPRGS